MLPKSKLGIIAGGGGAPKALIDACRGAAREVFVVCLEGQADKELAADVPHAWLPLGAGARLKELVAAQSIKEVVLIGRVRRPSLAAMKPDWLALKVLTRTGLYLLGDDGLLRGIGKALENEIGVRVLGAHEVCDDLLAPEGLLTRAAPDEVTRKDIEIGIKAARGLGARDVGQAVIVRQGIVLGEEDTAGTDALIARCAALKSEGAGGVLVKTAKPQQDDRFDLPAIGPGTVAAAAQAGLFGIAVEAGRSLLIEREKAVAQADEANVFILGFRDSHA